METGRTVCFSQVLLSRTGSVPFQLADVELVVIGGECIEQCAGRVSGCLVGQHRRLQWNSGLPPISEAIRSLPLTFFIVGSI